MSTKRDYNMTHEISRGISGIVHAATARNGLQVIVKQLSIEDGRREYDYLRRVDAANGPNLANVVRCLDKFVDGGDFFIVEEALLGTLDAFIGPSTITPYAFGYAAVGAIRGLAEIARADLVHCDVKAGNFGVSKTLQRIVAFDFASSTEIGGRTRGYDELTAPPEVRQGRPGRTSDVFGWARMLEMLTTGMVGFGPKYSIQEVRPWVGRAIAGLLCRATADDPEDRPDPLRMAELVKQALSTLHPRPGCGCLEFSDGLEPHPCGH